MNKQTKIIILVVAIILVAMIVSAIFFMPKGNKTNLDPVNSAEDLSLLVDKVYEGQENLLRSLNTRSVDVANNDDIKGVTGLENGKDLEFVVVSEPMIGSQAYSFVLAKVKEGKDANSIAKAMSEQVDARKWICVSAEKIYATNSGDVVCLVMSSEEWGKPIYDKFKELAGHIGEEYEKTQDEGFSPDGIVAL